MINVLGLTLYDYTAASTRYRLGQYAEGLMDAGIALETHSLLSNEYIRNTFKGGSYSVARLSRDYARRIGCLLKQRSYDLAIIHVELFPLLPGWIESRLLRIPYIYDFDDAFFLKYSSARFKYISPILRDKFTPVVERAAAVFAGNSYLVEYALERNSATTLLPTVVDTTRYVVAPNRREDVFTIGWIGSPSTSVYLSELADPLSRLGREGPVRLLVVGGRFDSIENVEVVNLPWSEASEIELINSFDVGVMPLFNDAWARGKCAFKLIQYMACGTPAVASPVGANLEVIDPTCGFLAGGAEEWLEVLRQLRDDPGLRKQLGTAARRKIVNEYSLAVTLPIMIEVIKKVHRQGC